MLYFIDTGIFLQLSLGSQGLQSNPMLTTDALSSTIKWFIDVMYENNNRHY
jgi:hypothetical protein